ncbi:hypothetical protein ScPMuIL_016275 [Solemya velum]
MSDRPKSILSTASSSVTHYTADTNAVLGRSPGAIPPPTHHRWTPYSGPVLFTGPSGNRDHRVSVTDDFQMVGIGKQSNELTGQLTYLNRPSPGEPFPKAKNGQVGEIGWPHETFKLVKGI